MCLSPVRSYRLFKEYNLSQSYGCAFLHIVWTTKRRIPCIPDSIKKRLYEYIGQLAQTEGLSFLAIGGTSNHVHILIKMQSGARAISDFMRMIKSGSSKFLNQVMGEMFEFRWQRGYSFFSVSASAVNKARIYIYRQEEHHEKYTLEDELEILGEKYEKN